MDPRRGPCRRICERGARSALYVVHGDEPLLALEAGDAIRAAARAAGVVEREVLVVEPGFKWDAFLGANANASLFGDAQARRPAHSVGQARRRRRQGARGLCRAIPNPDHVTLVTLPRLDRATQAPLVRRARRRGRRDRRVSGRARRAAGAGSRRGSRGRSSRRRAKRSRSSPSTAKATCSRRGRKSRSSRCCCRKASSTHDAVERAVADVARYDVVRSCPRRGSRATPRARCASCARSKPKATRHACDLAARRRRACAGGRARMVRAGTPVSAAVRNARVWGKRQAASERAVKRVGARPPRRCRLDWPRLDALAKGMGRGSAWDELAAAALLLCGKPLRPLACDGADPHYHSAPRADRVASRAVHRLRRPGVPGKCLVRVRRLGREPRRGRRMRSPLRRSPTGKFAWRRRPRSFGLPARRRVRAATDARSRAASKMKEALDPRRAAGLRPPAGFRVITHLLDGDPVDVIDQACRVARGSTCWSIGHKRSKKWRTALVGAAR